MVCYSFAVHPGGFNQRIRYSRVSIKSGHFFPEKVKVVMSFPAVAPRMSSVSVGVEMFKIQQELTTHFKNLCTAEHMSTQIHVEISRNNKAAISLL